MNHIVITDAAKSERLNGVFIDIATGVVVASDGVIGAAWKPTGDFIDARVCLKETRTRNTMDTLIQLHDAETIGAMEIDLTVLKRALEALMVEDGKDERVRQATLSIKQPKPNVFVLEIIERTMTSDAGATLLLMGLTKASQNAASVFDCVPRAPKQSDGDTTDTSNTASDEVQP